MQVREFTSAATALKHNAKKERNRGNTRTRTYKIVFQNGEKQQRKRRWLYIRKCIAALFVAAVDARSALQQQLHDRLLCAAFTRCDLSLGGCVKCRALKTSHDQVITNAH